MGVCISHISAAFLNKVLGLHVQLTESTASNVQGSASC